MLLTNKTPDPRTVTIINLKNIRLEYKKTKLWIQKPEGQKRNYSKKIYTAEQFA